MKIGRELSSGAYSRVYEVCNEDSVLKHNTVDKSSDYYRSLKELDILARLMSPNIVRIRSVVFDEIEGISPGDGMGSDLMHFVLERATCTLGDMLQDMEYDVGVIRSVFCHIFLGLHFMHHNDIIHRDIKPQNILYFDKTKTIKICDFGISEYYSKNLSYTVDMCTIWYRSPEMLLGNRDYDSGIDIWSTAIVMIETIAGGPIFNTVCTARTFVRLLLSKFPSLYPDMKAINNNGTSIIKPRVKRSLTSSISQLLNVHNPDEDLIDLLSKMITVKPSNRPSAEECLQHKFFDPMREQISEAITANTGYTANDYDIIINNVKRQRCYRFLVRVHDLVSCLTWCSSDRVFYHTMDMFDRCMEKGIEHRMLPEICFYFCCKLIYESNFPFSFNEVTFAEGTEDCAVIERQIIEKLEYRLYRRTIYEEFETPDLPWDIMDIYASIPSGVYSMKDMKALIQSKIK